MSIILNQFNALQNEPAEHLDEIDPPPETVIQECVVNPPDMLGYGQVMDLGDIAPSVLNAYLPILTISSLNVNFNFNRSNNSIINKYFFKHKKMEVKTIEKRKKLRQINNSRHKSQKTRSKN